MTFQCPICCTSKDMNENDGKELQCSHWLCWQCFAKFMRSSGSVNVICPLCRASDIHSSESSEVDDDLNEVEEEEGIIDINAAKTIIRINNITIRNCRFF